ncbi:hypothetical protein LX36DRAFT_356164 [Colletotrichum falcatum]|nr:hypothetical protein LX36DRAFT_356164 [Colletotrichum falcatum]
MHQSPNVKFPPAAGSRSTVIGELLSYPGGLARVETKRTRKTEPSSRNQRRPAGFIYELPMLARQCKSKTREKPGRRTVGSLGIDWQVDTAGTGNRRKSLHYQERLRRDDKNERKRKGKKSTVWSGPNLMLDVDCPVGRLGLVRSQGPREVDGDNDCASVDLATQQGEVGRP